MNTTRTTGGRVIDLAALAEPASRVVELFDEASRGQPPPPGRLQAALEVLGREPRPPGQLGADIAMLTNPDERATRDDVLAAIERLRRISTLQRSSAPTKRKRRRRRIRNDDSGQLQLPGLSTPSEAP